MATHSDRVTFFCCASCKDKENIEEYAAYYCAKCQQCFCRKCCELHDYLFSKHVTYDRGNMKNWPVSKELEAVLLMCETHTHKKLETFCKYHYQLCCSKCVSLSHRKCKTMKINSAKKKSSDVHQLSVKLRINMRKLKKLQSCCESSIQDLKSLYQGQERMVQKMNNKINYTVGKIVRTSLKKTPKVEKTKICELIHSTLYDIEKTYLNDTKITLFGLQASLNTGVETCNRHHHELKQLHECLLYSSDKNKKKLCFIASRKCMDKIQHVESYLDENCAELECLILNQTIQYTEQYIFKFSGLGRLLKSVKANTDIEQYLSKLSGLARIEYRNHVFTVQGNAEQNVHISSDSYIYFSIRAISVLPSGQVLVVDYNNNKVKLLNQQYQVVSHLDMICTPLDICQITPSEVAVAALGDFFHFIKVSESQLKTGRKLKLQHYCTGITHHQGDLFICSGSALYKYSLSGNMISKLYEDLYHTAPGWSVVQCAVSPTGDKLYTTSQNHPKLLTLNRNGTVLSTFEDPMLREPYGLNVTPAGQVLLVCRRPSLTILQLDSMGRRKLATWITDWELSPTSVCYNSVTSSIIVGLERSNICLVFRVE